MAWDTEGTRRRLKEAATAEFAEHGPDGTTMARIAERAGINKERLYKYFGDKQALFETVLTDELDKLAASVAPGRSGGGGDESMGRWRSSRSGPRRRRTRGRWRSCSRPWPRSAPESRPSR